MSGGQSERSPTMKNNFHKTGSTDPRDQVVGQFSIERLSDVSFSIMNSDGETICWANSEQIAHRIVAALVLVEELKTVA